MLADERHSFIRGELATKGRILAGDLAARFAVSEDTARRDLRDLAKAGECLRVYGGAVKMAPDAGPLQVRNDLKREEKMRLALVAIKLMRPGQSLFIDSGSTNIAIANAIPRNIELNVATSSLGVAAALAEHELVNLSVLGGAYNRDFGCCVGQETVVAISHIHADLLFLGSCGVDALQGATAFDSAEAEIKRAMVKNSSAIVVVSTADKLATAAPFRVVGPEEIDHLVISQEGDPAVIARFEQQDIRIYRA